MTTQAQKQYRADRLSFAVSDAGEAMAAASGHGLELRRCGSYHYQIRPVQGPEWIINLWPSTGKMHFDDIPEAGKAGRAPRIQPKQKWTLLDIVQLVIGAKQ